MIDHTKNSTLPSLHTSKSGKKIIILISIILLIGVASPKNIYSNNSVYYVSPNGNDSNPGTLDRPWRHIAHAASSSAVKPGDTIYIRAGTYNEKIEQKVSGAPGQFITYRNYPNEQPVISDGNSDGAVRWLVKDESYLRIEGLTFRNFHRTAISIRNDKESVTDVAIVNNLFEDQNARDGDIGKTLLVSTLKSGKLMHNIHIEGNEFYDLNTGVYPALQIEGDVRGATILNNIIAGTSNIAINVAGRPQFGQPERILVKGNDVSGFGLPGRHAPGIYLDGAGKFIVVEDNVVHDRKQGIRVNLENAASSLQTQHIILRHNVVYNVSSISMQLGVGGVPDDCNKLGELNHAVAIHNTIYTELDTTNHWFSCGINLRWKNNALVHEGSGGYQYRLENTSVNTEKWQSDYNYFYSTQLDKPFRWFNRDYRTVGSFYEVSGMDQYSISGAPAFTDQSSYDFTLQPESPLIDSGGALTFTKNAGSGRDILVDDALYFTDGFGLQPGDSIRIGNGNPVSVTDVDYTNHILTVDRDISWARGASVYYDYKGNSPDIGAFEFERGLELSVIPDDQALNVTWRMNGAVPANLDWHITYQVVNAEQGHESLVLPPEQTHLHIKDLENYQLYTVSVRGIVDGDIIVEGTSQMMPTDIAIYFPIIRN